MTFLHPNLNDAELQRHPLDGSVYSYIHCFYTIFEMGSYQNLRKLFFFQKNLTLLNSSWTQPAHLRYFTVRKYLNNNWKKQTNKPPTINKRFIYAKEVCFFPLTCVFKKLVTVCVRKKSNTQIWDLCVQLIHRQQGKRDSKENAISSTVMEPLYCL